MSHTARAAVLGLTGLLLAGVAPAPAAAETVAFDVAERNGPTITLTAELTRPEGDGPFAAVVMLHGCSGLYEPWGGPWSGRLVRWGYVALRVDSFGPRCYPDGICGRDGAVGEVTTAEDGHAAKSYLQGLIVFRTRAEEDYTDEEALGYVMDSSCPACGTDESVLVVVEEYREMVRMSKRPEGQ